MRSTILQNVVTIIWSSGTAPVVCRLNAAGAGLLAVPLPLYPHRARSFSVALSPHPAPASQGEMGCLDGCGAFSGPGRPSRAGRAWRSSGAIKTARGYEYPTHAVCPKPCAPPPLLIHIYPELCAPLLCRRHRILCGAATADSPPRGCLGNGDLCVVIMHCP